MITSQVQVKVLLVLLLLICHKAKSQSARTHLQLTPLIKSGNVTQARELAKVAHPKFHGLESYSGYLTVNKTLNSDLFFWYFPDDNKNYQAPLVIWLQGGPGYSSMYGLFLDIGPFIPSSAETLDLRKYSWHKYFNLLFFDIPVGVGFSLTSKVSIESINFERNLVNALEQFLLLFPDMDSRDLYIAGDSGGVHPLIKFGHRIHLRNQKTTMNKINLKGFISLSGFLDMSKQMNFADHWYQLGLIDDNQREFLFVEQNKTLTLIDEGKLMNAFQIYSDIALGTQELTPYGSHFTNFTGSRNYMNYLLTEVDQTLKRNMISFLNLEEIQSALHTANITYAFESSEVKKLLYLNLAESLSDWVKELLLHYKWLAMNGELDSIVPYVFADNYWNSLNFSAPGDYANAKKSPLYQDDELIGHYKMAGNLTQVFVKNAGHEMTRDQPKWVLHVVYNFIYNISLE